jgi:hypothetical protein
VTPVQLHKSDFVFRFYIYGGTFDSPPEDFFFFLSARRTIFGALCPYGFFGFVWTTGVLSAPILDIVVWDGGLPFSGILRGWLHTRAAIARPVTDFFYLVSHWFGFITLYSVFEVSKN